MTQMSLMFLSAALVVLLSVSLYAAPATPGGPGASAAQGGPQQLQIVKFTGQIQIKIGNDVIGIVPGGAIPPIPAGAEVIVLSGEAVFQSGGTAISAKAGDSFTFNVTASASPGGAPSVQISGTSDTSIKVSVGKAEAVVTKGDVISVAATVPGKADVQVLNGKVEVTVSGQTQTLAQGQSVSTEVATTVAAAPPPTAPPPSAPPKQPAGEPPPETTGGPEEAPPSEPPPPPPPNPSQETKTVSPSSP